MGHQKNGDPLVLDQRDHVLHHACAHDCIEGCERLIHQEELWLHRQHLRKRNALALAAAQSTGKAIAEAGKIEPVEPGFRLGERFVALHSIESEAERDIVTCRLPRQQGIVLEQDSDPRARKVRLNRARERLLQPDHGT
jgi:hypothetical protein